MMLRQVMKTGNHTTLTELTLIVQRVNDALSHRRYSQHDLKLNYWPRR